MRACVGSLKYFPVDYSVMVISPSTGEIKSSTARVMEKIDAVFVADSLPGRISLSEVRQRLRKRGGDVGEIPIFYEADLAQLSDRITQIHRSRTTIEHTDSY